MSYTIEVTGIDSQNKGALLMLDACCQQVRHRLPESRMAISYRFDPAMRLSHGLWSALPRERLRPGIAGAWGKLPDPICRIGTLVRRREIDVVLDASGFAYGDAWPTKKLEYRLARTILERPAGSKVILLPQAFGPFSDPRARDLLKKTLPKADLVFARDDDSFGYLRDVLGGVPANLHRAPDFSNLLKAPELEDESLAGGYWIVPNTKVLEKDVLSANPRYIEFLARSVQVIRGRGFEPRILIHEGPKDLAVARMLNERLDVPLHVHCPHDGLAAKAILSRAAGLISSRYHALVSALASAVPALACGWSHKYDALMQDYGLDEAVVELNVAGDWLSKVTRLLDVSADQQAREALRHAADLEKTKSTEMWNTVFACIQTA